MQPRPMIYYKCPGCENIISCDTCISYNNFGAKHYSDGRELAPMLPEYPRVTLCNECGFLLWLKEEYEVPAPQNVKPVSPFIDSEFGSDFVHYGGQHAEFLEPYQYKKILDIKAYKTKNEERYLRLRFWWSINDKIREYEVRGNEYFVKESYNDQKIRFDSIFRDSDGDSSKLTDRLEENHDKIITQKYYEESGCIDNMKQFILLLKDEITKLSKNENTDEIINKIFMIAELQRNLGNFEECRQTLKEITDPEISWLKELFEKECSKENRFVFLIERNEQE